MLLFSSDIKEERMGKNKVYIANDVEAAGHRLGIHTTLSIGACVVTREPLTFDEASDKRLVFYAELRPISAEYEFKAMKKGCLHLECLDEIRKVDSRYNPEHKDFDPKLVLELMDANCESPRGAVQRLSEWTSWVSNGGEVEGVVDTVFFDSGHYNLNFGLNIASRSPYKWNGLDIGSMYRGMTGNPDARLSGLGVNDDRQKPHRADHDAHYIAKVTSKLIYEKLRW
jgi:hypothetical protein